MLVLLVEDDPSLATALKLALQNQGYSVNAVATGAAALHVVESETPDCVILDLGLPDVDGMQVLKRIRAHHVDLPVLLLTARSDLEDKIAGLDSGADDYLAKPFEMTELFARLRVLERRLSTTRSSKITIGEVTLDINSGQVSVNGEEIELARREYMLLKSLMESAGRVLTRSTLESRLYSWGEEVSSNTLEVHVHHLRKKLGTQFISTVRGVGYKVKAA
ncbi:response regulator [Elongatibacter sediminis]|uniref:Response regulator n=1 Tax=Elongatibacter sediminis TaxID=3119006 RepID=A0AAW9RG48_9GAMM